MPRVTTVASAQKPQGNCRRCGIEIKAGDKYYWFANLIGRTSTRKVFCSQHPPKDSDKTTSDKLSQLYAAREALEEAIVKASNGDEMAQACNDAAEQAREVAEAYRESVGNMPENLQQGSQAQEMEEKADNCDSWADSLESAASEIENLDGEPDLDDECASCGKMFSEHEGTEEADSKDGHCEEFEPQGDPLEEARGFAEDACGELSV